MLFKRNNIINIAAELLAYQIKVLQLDKACVIIAQITNSRRSDACQTC